AAALLPLATEAFARAGGGGHYSGGGGGFGGGGFGGGGGGGGLYFVVLYVEFVVEHPLVGLPITAFFAYVAWQVYGQSDVMLVSDDRMHRTIRDAAGVQGARRRDAALAALRARDPGFSVEAFLSRVTAAFLKTQAAWSAQDMASARAFISDGVMERFTIQLAMAKADGKRDLVTDVRVGDASIVELESDAHFDTVHVRLEASAVDQEVALADGRRVFGSGSRQGFTEVWSFLRRPGAKTLERPGLVEGACPNCGAPLELSDAARCPRCKSWVNSGEYDWVLSEITQESEWAVRGGGEAVPGFAELAAKDPALNTQFLEDRASLVFWRWQWAFSQGTSAPLRAVAADGCCRALETEMARAPVYFRDAAVGAVEVQAVETGSELDLAHVLVKWSGDSFEGPPGKGRERGPALRQHVIVLERKAGAATDARAGLRSAACPSCGAPASGPDQAKCEYCGAAFNDGARSWVAREIVPVGLWRRPAGAEAAAPEEDGGTPLRALA
ncbi:MAG: TIM44-like domain-containing protein, partial [Elusimicrobia bacterium]|nr:TIM44-like domain-containing protein [Elusimicrobiota bacterium]